MMCLEPTLYIQRFYSLCNHPSSQGHLPWTVSAHSWFWFKARSLSESMFSSPPLLSQTYPMTDFSSTCYQRTLTTFVLHLLNMPKASCLIARNKLFHGTPNTIFNCMGNLSCSSVRDLGISDFYSHSLLLWGCLAQLPFLLLFYGH